jgi:hypothetical protein
MKRTTLALLLASGCASAPQIYLPNTPEANSCARECMSIYNVCRSRPESSGRRCRGEEERCRSTCPGAKTEEELNAMARERP